MDKNKYYNVYTHLIKKYEGRQKPNTIVINNSIEVISDPLDSASKFRISNMPIIVYCIIPSIQTEKFYDSITKTADNPRVTSIIIIGNNTNLKNKFLNPKIQTLFLNKWTGLTYQDVFNVMNPHTINILLCDSICLDYNTLVNATKLADGTVGVLSSRKFTNTYSDNAYDYENLSELRGHSIYKFSGFIFKGIPTVYCDFYINIYGSRHLLVKKFYNYNFSVVNVSTFILSYMFEKNIEYYSKKDTYFNIQNFSIIILLPQINDDSVAIDSQTIEKTLKTVPDVNITEYTFRKLQAYDVVLDDFKKIEIGLIENSIMNFFTNKYNSKYESRYNELINEIQTKREALNEELRKTFSEKYNTSQVTFEETYNNNKREKEKELARYIESLKTDARLECNLQKEQNLLQIKLEQAHLLNANAEELMKQESKLMGDIKQKLDSYYTTEFAYISSKLENFNKTKMQELNDLVTESHKIRFSELEESLNTKKQEIEKAVLEYKTLSYSNIDAEVNKKVQLAYENEIFEARTKMLSEITNEKNHRMSIIDLELKQHLNAGKHANKCELDAEKEIIKEKVNLLYNEKLREIDDTIKNNKEMKHIMLENRLKLEYENEKRNMDSQLADELKKYEYEQKTVVINNLSGYRDIQEREIRNKLKLYEETEKRKIDTKLQEKETIQRELLIECRTVEINEKVNQEYIALKTKIEEKYANDCKNIESKMTNDLELRKSAINLELEEYKTLQLSIIEKEIETARFSNNELIHAEELNALARAKQKNQTMLNSLKDELVSASAVITSEHKANVEVEQQRILNDMLAEYCKRLEEQKVNATKKYTIDLDSELLRLKTDRTLETKIIIQKLEEEGTKRIQQLTDEKEEQMKKHKSQYESEIMQLGEQRIAYHQRELDRLKVCRDEIHSNLITHIKEQVEEEKANILAAYKEELCKGAFSDIDREINKKRLTDLEYLSKEMSEVKTKLLKQIEDTITVKNKEAEQYLQIQKQKYENEKIEMDEQRIAYHQRELDRLKICRDEIHSNLVHHIKEQIYSEKQELLSAHKKELYKTAFANIDEEIEKTREEQLEKLSFEMLEVKTQSLKQLEVTIASKKKEEEELLATYLTNKRKELDMEMKRRISMIESGIKSIIN